MFSDIFITIAAFLYAHAPVIIAIIIALTVLNGVRLMMRSWRKQRWIQRQITIKQNQNVDWTMLENL